MLFKRGDLFLQLADNTKQATDFNAQPIDFRLFGFGRQRKRRDLLSGKEADVD